VLLFQRSSFGAGPPLRSVFPISTFSHPFVGVLRWRSIPSPSFSIFLTVRKCFSGESKLFPFPGRQVEVFFCRNRFLRASFPVSFPLFFLRTLTFSCYPPMSRREELLRRRSRISSPPFLGVLPICHLTFFLMEMIALFPVHTQEFPPPSVPLLATPPVPFPRNRCLFSFTHSNVCIPDHWKDQPPPRKKREMVFRSPQPFFTRIIASVSSPDPPPSVLSFFPPTSQDSAFFPLSKETQPLPPLGSRAPLKAFHEPLRVLDPSRTYFSRKVFRVKLDYQTVFPPPLTIKGIIGPLIIPFSFLVKGRESFFSESFQAFLPFYFFLPRHPSLFQELHDDFRTPFFCSPPLKTFF